MSPDDPVVTMLNEGDSLANVDSGEFPLEEVLSGIVAEIFVPDIVASGPSPPLSSPACPPVDSPAVDGEDFVKPLPPRARKGYKVSAAVLVGRIRSASPSGRVRSRSPV